MSEFDAKAREWDDPTKVERARRVADLIAARAPELAGARMLEVGAGTGLLGLALRDRARHVTLADGSAGMLAVAREKVRAQGAPNVDVIELDLVEGPWPVTRFDVICALLVLHHVPDTGALLRRLHQLLEPGGRLFISDLEAEDGSFHGADFGGHHGFDREELAGELERSGFTEIRFEHAFQLQKLVGGEQRSFEAFLVAARRD